MQQPRPLGRASRFFFMHLGTLFGVVVYVVLGERGGWTAGGVAHALRTALGVHTLYMLVAGWQRELKQFDVGFWMLFAVGTLAAAVGATPVLDLYQRYAGALIFTTMALTAAAPLVLGYQPFTVYHGLRAAPRWQWGTPSFQAVMHVMAVYWTFLFGASAALCIVRPRDPMFTFVYPNLLIFLIGLGAGRWMPALWLRFFPAPLPETAGALIMGLPFVFDPAAAKDARAVVQYRVNGRTPGDYWVRIEGGRCESFEGVAAEPDLTIHTPHDVWVDIAHGRLDGAQALMEGRYRADGDLAVLLNLPAWFRAR